MILFDVVKRIWLHPSNRHRRLRALKDAISWQAYKRMSRDPQRCREIEVFGSHEISMLPQ